MIRAKMITAEDFHAAPPGMPDLPVAARTLVWHSQHFKVTGEIPNEGFDNTIVIHAIISAGRWCARCLWCPASEYAADTDRRFMCSQCHNGGTGVWVAVQWPDDQERALIEGVLELRPNPQTRNWESPETPLQLALESEAMGIPTRDRMGL